MTQKSHSLDAVLAVHVHQNELQLVLSSLCQDVKSKVVGHLMDFLSELVEVLVD